MFGRGGAAIIEPTAGELIAGPLYDQEGIVVADCDLRRGLHAKRWFDAVGHYSAEAALGTEPAAHRLPTMATPQWTAARSPASSSRPGSP